MGAFRPSPMPRRRGHAGRWAALLGLSVAIVVGAGAPARADHEVTIVHRPQPAAKAAMDLRVPLVVDGCSVFCSPVRVELRYRTAAGERRSVRATLGTFSPQAAILVVPGIDVVAPAFQYRLDARQDECWFDACHEDRSRAPARGRFSVPVF